MSSFNTASGACSWFSLFYLLCGWILGHNVLLIFCCVFILTLIVPRCIVTFLLTFSFSITFFCFTVMTNIWAIGSKMSFFITTVTDYIWQVIICWPIIRIRISRLILCWFFMIICWLWGFGSWLIRMLSSWWAVIGIMTRLFTTITHNLIRRSVVCWRDWSRIWIILSIWGFEL